MTTSFYYTVKCPQCGALVGHPCHNKHGDIIRPHEHRKMEWRKKEGKF